MSTDQPSDTSRVPMSGVIPHLICDGAADAIAFYARAFGAVELARLPGPDGRLMHAMIRIGDAVVMLNDEFPDHGAVGPTTRGGTSVTLHRYVPDVDAAYAQALAAGATVVMPVGDQFWGDRHGVLADPWGHCWSLATHLRDVGVDEMQQAMAAMAVQAPGCH